jgi:hypothetical protein
MTGLRAPGRGMPVMLPELGSGLVKDVDSTVLSAVSPLK